MATSAPSPPQNTLRSKQIAALKRMLNLNQPLSSGAVAAAEPVWKVLVYDKFGSDIISPLLSVKELRDMGVTLHLQIDSPRDQISDAVAVYFVMPTPQNVSRMCEDCRAQLYDKYYLNFVTAIPRPLLEELAKTSLETNCVSQIAKVYDQYLNFISLEDEFFIMRHQMTRDISYYALNKPDALDTDIQRICDSIVESLFSVFVTSGTVPIIRCPRGNAAEMVAAAVDKKLRDNVRDPRNSMFSGDGTAVAHLSFSRPLLVILDRNVDLATPLHHTWTYQALTHDVLDLQLNRVRLSASEGTPPPSPTSPAPQQRTYDLLHSDKFWHLHRGSPFPTMADSVQAELNEYKTSEEEVMALKSAMGVGEDEDPDSAGALTDKTSKLGTAIKSLPELMEKKKSIDMHTNIATALLDQIKERKLDVFFEMEDKMISKSSLDKKTVLDILSDPTAGTAEDKMRLFGIYYILSPDMSEADLTQYSTALEEVGANTAPLSYLKQWKAISKMKSPRSLGNYTASTTSVSSVVSHWMSSGSKWMEGVKNLVVGTKNLPVTRVVEQLMEQRTSGQLTEDYCYFDPKQLRLSDSRSTPQSKTPFTEAYVFVVGGGNYIEYQNLKDYCQRQQTSRHITYGTSQLMDARQFLQQLAELGTTNGAGE